MLRRMPCVAGLLFFSFLASAQTTLNGAGSAFAYPIMSKWMAEYHKLHPEIRMSYYPNGSWPGMVLTMAGMIDFGATDAAVSDAQLAKSKAPIIQIPVVTAGLGGIKEASFAVPTHSNLRGSIRNASATNAAPVARFTWILVPVRAKDPKTRKALKEFLVWIVTDGQKYATDLYCSPLPTEVAAEARRVLDEYH